MGLRNRAIRIEAAAYRGTPVWFKIIGEWQRPLRMEPFKLARRSLLAGRGDRPGAMTITLASIILGSLIWLLRAHHLSEVAREFQLAVVGFLDVLLVALTAVRDAPRAWLPLQDEMAPLSSNRLHHVLANATHSGVARGF